MSRLVILEEEEELEKLDQTPTQEQIDADARIQWEEWELEKLDQTPTQEQIDADARIQRAETRATTLRARWENNRRFRIKAMVGGGFLAYVTVLGSGIAGLGSVAIGVPYVVIPPLILAGFYCQTPHGIKNVVNPIIRGCENLLRVAIKSMGIVRRPVDIEEGEEVIPLESPLFKAAKSIADTMPKEANTNHLIRVINHLFAGKELDGEMKALMAPKRAELEAARKAVADIFAPDRPIKDRVAIQFLVISNILLEVGSSRMAMDADKFKASYEQFRDKIFLPHCEKFMFKGQAEQDVRVLDGYVMTEKARRDQVEKEREAMEGARNIAIMRGERAEMMDVAPIPINHHPCVSEFRGDARRKEGMVRKEEEEAAGDSAPQNSHLPQDVSRIIQGGEIGRSKDD